MWGGGWWVYAWGNDQDKSKSVTWPLVKRVLSYARASDRVLTDDEVRAIVGAPVEKRP